MFARWYRRASTRTRGEQRRHWRSAKVGLAFDRLDFRRLIIRSRPILLAAALVIAPLSARAADLVVWWEKGYHDQENAAVAEIVAAFAHSRGKQAELVLLDEEELPGAIATALAAGLPPDFAFGGLMGAYISEWAFGSRLVDLSDAIGGFANIFDPDALERAMLVDAATGRRGLYALPMGRINNHLHVWKSLLEQAGLTLADVPREWAAFWSFWCDEVQPAVRRATARDNVWGIGLPMSPVYDTHIEFFQFVAANQADYVTADGRLRIDDPEIRQKLIGAVDSYTAIYKKGCSPPDAVSWGNPGNNKAFLGQMVVMTPNDTLSIPNALRHERPDDYYQNSATIEWPLGPAEEPFPIMGNIYLAVVFRDGANVDAAKEFVRFLVAEGWLAHYLDFSAERMLPPISALLEQPFWLDPSDPHRMASVMQLASRPLAHNYAAASGDWRHDRVEQEYVWANAIHRVAAEGISPEQAVDEAIARIKEILSE
jgi:multiple sugar transport system substrate-binding protein